MCSKFPDGPDEGAETEGGVAWLKPNPKTGLSYTVTWVEGGSKGAEGTCEKQFQARREKSRHFYHLTRDVADTIMDPRPRHARLGRTLDATRSGFET